MAFVHVNGIDLHYTVDGTQGPWMTLSHSLACNLSAWDAQVEVLKTHFRVLRFDSRGHGQTSAPPGPYTLDQMAADVHGLFLHLGIERTHWLGISMGGMIGQTYALAHPSCFESLILADSTSRRPLRLRRCGARAFKLRKHKACKAWWKAPWRVGLQQTFA
jgi:3-oxoadipate enol-lactonase